jgi:lipopolysaccharide/colanic/teichoic acid biosynthesis glycosyltransferase
LSYKIIETQDAIAKIKPGLTGVGSIIFRNEESIINNSSKPPEECYKEDITPYKGELEKWFSQNQSLYLYFLLIFITAWVVFFPKSGIVWKVFSSLPTPPDKIQKLLNFSSDRSTS